MAIIYSSMFSPWTAGKEKKPITQILHKHLSRRKAERILVILCCIAFILQSFPILPHVRLVVSNTRPKNTNLETKNQLFQSQIIENKDGRYVLSNVFVWSDYIYFITDELNVTIPPVLCSTFDLPVAVHCNIEVLSYEKFTQLYSSDEMSDDIGKFHIVDRALMLHSLHPGNSYHIVWEAVIPAISMLLEDGKLPRNPLDMVRYFQNQNWSLFFTHDWSYYNELNRNWWRELLPNIQIPSPIPIYLVKKLIVGTRGRCAHSGHCSNSTFSPEDSALVLRNFIAQTHGFPKSNTLGSFRNSVCRITVVQRRDSRTIINFDLWVASIRDNHALGPREVRAVDFADYSIREQMLIASTTDVLVMVHGGGLVHATWLPLGASVVDINPYMYFHRGLINWMRYNLRDLHLGHHLIQINYTEGQYINGQPLPENCLCYDENCGPGMFHKYSGITLDIPIFEKELWRAVEKWRNQDYEKSVSNPDFYQMFHRENQIWQNEIQRDAEERSAKGLPKRVSCV